MLILGRKIGESLLIGEDIRISVVSAERGRVRLSIDAPKSVSILRSELLGAMDFNQDAAREEASPLDLLDMLAPMLESGEPPRPFTMGREGEP